MDVLDEATEVWRGAEGHPAHLVETSGDIRRQLLSGELGECDLDDRMAMCPSDPHGPLKLRHAAFVFLLEALGPEPFKQRQSAVLQFRRRCDQRGGLVKI